jgi:hypothetical protein
MHTVGEPIKMIPFGKKVGRIPFPCLPELTTSSDPKCFKKANDQKSTYSWGILEPMPPKSSGHPSAAFRQVDVWIDPEDIRGALALSVTAQPSCGTCGRGSVSNPWYPHDAMLHGFPSLSFRWNVQEYTITYKLIPKYPYNGFITAQSTELSVTLTISVWKHRPMKQRISMILILHFQSITSRIQQQQAYKQQMRTEPMWSILSN